MSPEEHLEPHSKQTLIIQQLFWSGRPGLCIQASERRKANGAGLVQASRERCSWVFLPSRFGVIGLLGSFRRLC